MERNEWKYILDQSEREKLSFNLEAILDKDVNADENGEYMVHSLYFDDSNDSCAQEVEAGINCREKFRIRYYENSISTLRLEKKIKKNNICYKKACNITKDDYIKIIENDVDELLFGKDELLIELSSKIITRNLRPKVIIEYKRKAFIDKHTNTRITFDNQVCVSNDIDDFLNYDYLKSPILNSNETILEIKHDKFLPVTIRKLCNTNHLNRISFSKYYLAYTVLNGGRINENYRNY